MPAHGRDRDLTLPKRLNDGTPDVPCRTHHEHSHVRISLVFQCFRAVNVCDIARRRPRQDCLRREFHVIVTIMEAHDVFSVTTSG